MINVQINKCWGSTFVYLYIDTITTNQIINIYYHLANLSTREAGFRSLPREQSSIKLSLNPWLIQNDARGRSSRITLKGYFYFGSLPPRLLPPSRPQLMPSAANDTTYSSFSRGPLCLIWCYDASGCLTVYIQVVMPKSRPEPKFELELDRKFSLKFRHFAELMLRLTQRST